MNRACAGKTALDLFPAPPRDHGVEVHTVWDRCWAATHGLPMGQVFRLRSWDYGQKRPGSWME